MSVSRASWMVLALMLGVLMLGAAACGDNQAAAIDANPAVTVESTTAQATPTAGANETPEPGEPEPTTEPTPSPTATPVETPTPPVAPTPERFLASEIVVEGTPGDPSYEAQVALVGAWQVFQAAAADPESNNPEELAVFIEEEGSPLWESWHNGLVQLAKDGIVYRYPPESHREIVDVIVDSDSAIRITACIVDAAIEIDVESGLESPIGPDLLQLL